jgi:hypothetical protein
MRFGLCAEVCLGTQEARDGDQNRVRARSKTGTGHAPEPKPRDFIPVSRE